MLQDFRRRTLPETGGPRLAALRQAMAEAGVDPARIGYWEAHGTGTQAGDPAEARAIGEAVATAPLLAWRCVVALRRPRPDEGMADDPTTA